MRQSFARVLIATAIMLACQARALKEDPLPRLGQPAPPLGDAVVWLKGAPAPRFQPGTVYVLDFWATWCPSCLMAIPELSKTAAAYQDRNVEVIGVAVLPQQEMTPTARFVRDRAKRIGYTIAEDKAGQIAQGYGLAKRGIPTLAIVDHRGRLAWLGGGFPAVGFPEALASIVDGSYDLKAEMTRTQQAAGVTQRARDMLTDYKASMEAGKFQEGKRHLEAILALDASLFAWLPAHHFETLLHELAPLDRAAEAYAFAGTMIDHVIADHHVSLDILAWTILDLEDPLPRDLQIAMSAANKAIALAGNRWTFLRTRAEIYFQDGAYLAARDTQIQVLKQAIWEHADEILLAEIRADLDRYEEALVQVGETVSN